MRKGWEEPKRKAQEGERKRECVEAERNGGSLAARYIAVSNSQMRRSVYSSNKNGHASQSHKRDMHCVAEDGGEGREIYLKSFDWRVRGIPQLLAHETSYTCKRTIIDGQQPTCHPHTNAQYNTQQSTQCSLPGIFKILEF